MKKTIKFSAMMLTLLAAIFVSSCSKSTSSEDVAGVLSIINNITSEIKSSDGDMSKIQAASIKADQEIAKYENSNAKLTEGDKEELGKAVYEMGVTTLKAAGMDVDFPAFSEIKDELMPKFDNLSTVGDFVKAVKNGQFN